MSRGDPRDRIARAVERANTAAAAAEAALAAAYPVGSEVRFVLSSNQLRPSRGDVIAHSYAYGMGLLRVRLDSPSQVVRDIAFLNVLPSGGR